MQSRNVRPQPLHAGGYLRWPQVASHHDCSHADRESWRWWHLTWHALAVALIRLDWTREEIILAMDLYVTVGAFNGGPIPGNSSAQIVQLSDLLKEPGATPVRTPPVTVAV
jgi:hypothetical protein